MSLLFVCVRVAGRPVGTYTKGTPRDASEDMIIRPGYRAGLYAIKTHHRDGHKFMHLVGDIPCTGARGKSFEIRSQAVKHARSVCDSNKDLFLYLDGIKNNTKLNDLRSPEEILVLLDFYEAMA